MREKKCYQPCCIEARRGMSAAGNPFLLPSTTILDAIIIKNADDIGYFVLFSYQLKNKQDIGMTKSTTDHVYMLPDHVYILHRLHVNARTE